MIGIERFPPLARATAVGRGLVAIIFMIITATNVVAALVVHPWGLLDLLGQALEFEGLAWSRELAVFTGILLVLVAWALARGRRHAWWLCIGLVGFSLLGTLREPADRLALLLTMALLLFLVVLAPLFPIRSDGHVLLRGYSVLAVGTGCLLGLDTMGQFGGPGTLFGIPLVMERFAAVVHPLALVLLGYGIVTVLRPVRCAPVQQLSESWRAHEVVRRYGYLAMGYFTLSTDMSYFWSKTGQSLIAYRVFHSVALALGDPIGPEDEVPTILQAFLKFCQQQGWEVAFYQVSARTQRYGHLLRLHSYKIGEEAIIDVARFTLQGKAGEPVRHSVARAKRGGLTVQCWQGEELPQDVFLGMKHISLVWTQEQKATLQLGFSMGRFPADWSTALLTAVALGPEGEVQAFVTWTPLYAGNGWALDMMRRAKATTPGAMELLISESVAWAKAQGCQRMSLSLAPLVGLAEESDSVSLVEEACTAVRNVPLLEHGMAFFHQRGMLLGQYRSLAPFKAKFLPFWEARYLIVSRRYVLPKAAIALVEAHGGGWWPLLTKPWETLRPAAKNAAPYKEGVREAQQ